MANDGLESNLKVDPKKPPIGMPKRVTIVLEENDSIPPTGQFIGVNGKGYLLRPGERASVPEAILEVLDNAVTSTPVVDNYSKRVVGYRPKLRYPYRIVD